MKLDFFKQWTKAVAIGMTGVLMALDASYGLGVLKMDGGEVTVGQGSIVIPVRYDFDESGPGIVDLTATIFYPDELVYEAGALTAAGSAANDPNWNDTPFSHDLGNRTVLIAISRSGVSINADIDLATLEFSTKPGVLGSPTVQVVFSDNLGETYVTPAAGVNTLPALENANVKLNKLTNAPPVVGEIVIYQGTPSTGNPVDETDLQEDGQYYVVVSASDIDNPFTDLTATITYRGQTLAPVTRDETGPNSATFTAVLPMDFDAVLHPNRTADYAIEVVLDDNEGQNNEATAALETTVHDVDRPPVSGLTVTLPPTAITTDQVTAVPSGYDVNGDPDGDAITVVYAWNLEGQAMGSFGVSPTLNSSATTKGDVWQVTARLQTNPYGDGPIIHDAPEASAEVTILNSDPVLGLLAHKMFIQKPTPVPPTVAKSFNLAAALPSDADDDDALQYIITQLPDPARGTLSYEGALPSRGTVIDSVPTTLPPGVATVLYTVTAPTIEFFDGNDGPQADEFQYKVTDGDGDEPIIPEEFRGVSLQPAVVKVEYRENQPPEIVGTPSPVEAVDMDEVIDEAGTPNSQTFEISFTDEEDPSNNGEMERIDWYVSADNGTTWILQEQGAPVRAQLDGSFVFETDYETIYNGIDGIDDQRPESKVFQVKAVGVDTQGGETEHIWNVTVNDVDRLPTAPTVAITPKPAYTDDDLLATVTVASTDPDGDLIVDYEFAWNQTARVVLYTDTLTADNTAKHETWQVSARAVTNPYGSVSLPQRDGGDYRLGEAGTDSVTISNSPPVATDDCATTDEDTATIILVIAGDNGDTRNDCMAVADTDADDGDGDELVVKGITQPSKGVASIVDGGKAIEFDPNGQFEYLAPNDSEQVSFTYTVTDGDLVDEGTDTATVTVTVTGVNDPAIVQDMTVTTDIDEAVIFEVTAVDPDEGQTHEFFVHNTPGLPACAQELDLKAPEHGTVEVVEALLIDRDGEGMADGSIAAMFKYIPAAGFTGVDSFEFIVFDGDECSNVGTVTVVVGTPLWYPFFDLADYMSGRGERIVVEQPWYRVSILDAQNKRVVDTRILGTQMNPLDYFKAGSEGLLPDVVIGGSYVVQFQQWNPTTGSLIGVQQTFPLSVKDYGYAGMPDNLEVFEPDSRTSVVDPDTYVFKFRTPNARGYELEIYRNNGVVPYRSYRNVFLPDVEGRLAPTQEMELEVKLTEAGSYTAQVRGFNPLDDWEEGGTVRTVYEQQWADFLPFVINQGAAADVPGQPQDLPEAIFPKGEVIVAPNGVIDITLQWTPVAGAVSYALYLGAGNAAPLYNGQIGNQTSLRIPVPVGSYGWQVVAINAAGKGMWSPGYVFDVVADLSAPMIDEERVILVDGQTLMIGYLNGSPTAVAVDIQHFETVGTGTWKVFKSSAGQVAVSQPGGSQLIVSTANFQVGDFVFIKAYGGPSNKSTDYRMFQIRPGLAPARE